MPLRRQRSKNYRDGLDATQKKVFTNWLNDRLKGSGYKVTDLSRDMDDGMILIKLLETLVPGKTMPAR